VLSLPTSVKLWFAGGVDLRLGFDELANLVRNQLKADPTSGHLLMWPSLSPSPNG
jgi:transposase